MTTGAPAGKVMIRLGILAGAQPRSGGQGLLDASVRVAEAAERSGFDSFWFDERPSGRAPPSNAVPDERESAEAFTVLGALAARTERIRLGAVPASGDERAPAVLAKLVTAVDVISHGRSMLVLEGGSDRTGGVLLSEQLQVCRAVLEDEQPTFHGALLVIDGAVNRPSPVQARGVPVVVFAADAAQVDPGVLRAAGRLADGLVLGGDGAAWDGAASTVRAEAGHANREAGAIELVRYAVLECPAPGGPGRDAAGAGLEDRVHELATEASARIESGAGGCLVSFDGRPSLSGLLESIEVVGRVLGVAVGAALARRPISDRGS